MAFAPDPERELRQSVRQARMVAFVCTFVAPAMYIISLGSQVLHGRWELFLAGFGRLPWRDPRVSGALGAAVLAMVLVQVLPPRLGSLRDPRSALGALKLRSLVRSALMVAVAVCGLWVGVKIGPPAASFALVLCLVPMVRCWSLLPSEARWRAALDGGPASG